MNNYKDLIMDFYSFTEISANTLCYTSLLISTGINGTFIILVLQLIFLHKWLCKYDLTTYEYIVYLRENSGGKIDFSKIRKNHKSKVITRIDKESECSEINLEYKKTEVIKESTQKWYSTILL